MNIFDKDNRIEIISVLKKNKVRTFLTGFGVFWGMFMLLVMIGAGSGLDNGVKSEFKNFASNSMFIWAQKTTIPFKGFNRDRNFNFRNSDIEYLKRNIPEIDILCPRANSNHGGSSNIITRGKESGNFNTIGDTPDYPKIDPVILKEGRYLNEKDILETRKVAVIGDRVRAVLFEENEQTVGEYININGIYFQVIGVIEPLNKKMNFGGDKSENIHIPISTYQKTYNWGDIIGYFAITAKPNIPVSIIEQKALKLLAKKHDISPLDKQAFGYFNLEERFAMMNNLFTGINFIVWFVGIITLLAGVIGVSNIMLITVKERTKEFGIKRAIGATPRLIMIQLIIETIFLTLFAGIFGILLGVWSVEGAGLLIPDNGGMFKHPEIKLSTALISLTILIVSGAIAGLIPAIRAIKIKPVMAIRDKI